MDTLIKKSHILSMVKELAVTIPGIKDIYLVGGSVRDVYLDFNKIKELKDFDFEVHLTDSNLDHYDTFIKSLSSHLATSVESLNFNIKKIEYSGVSLEFTLPRLEQYIEQDCYKHGDFSVETKASLSIEEAIKRRDFTINSLYYSLYEDKVIDVLGGVDDLSQKALKPCELKNFYNDPVRLLRSIRFRQKFKLAYDFDLSKFDLSLLNPLHLQREYKKAHRLEFLIELKEMIGLFHIKTPQWLNKFLDCLNEGLDIESYEDIDQFILSSFMRNTIDEPKARSLIIDDFKYPRKNAVNFFKIVEGHQLKTKLDATKDNSKHVYFIGMEFKDIKSNTLFNEWHKVLSYYKYLDDNDGNFYLNSLSNDQNELNSGLNEYTKVLEKYKNLHIKYDESIPKIDYSFYKTYMFLVKSQDGK